MKPLKYCMYHANVWETGRPAAGNHVLQHLPVYAGYTELRLNNCFRMILISINRNSNLHIGNPSPGIDQAVLILWGDLCAYT